MGDWIRCGPIFAQMFAQTPFKQALSLGPNPPGKISFTIMAKIVTNETLYNYNFQAINFGMVVKHSLCNYKNITQTLQNHLFQKLIL